MWYTEFFILVFAREKGMKETPFSLSSEIVIDQFFIQDESQGAITEMYPPNFYDDKGTNAWIRMGCD